MSSKDEDASGTSTRHTSSSCPSSEGTPVSPVLTARKKSNTAGDFPPSMEMPPQSHFSPQPGAVKTTTTNITTTSKTSPKHSSVEDIIPETAGEAPTIVLTPEASLGAQLPQHILPKPQTWSASQKQPNFPRQILQTSPRSPSDYSSSSSSVRKSSPENAPQQKDAQPVSSSAKEDTKDCESTANAYQLQSKKKRFRRSYNCGPCKTHKIKCDMRIPCGNCEKYDRRDECLRDPPNPPTYQQYLIKQERKRKYLEKRYHLVSSRQEQPSQGPQGASIADAADPSAKQTYLSSPQKLQYESANKPYDDVARQNLTTVSPNSSVNRSESFKYSQPFSNNYREQDYRANQNALIDYKTYYQGAGIQPSTNIHQNTPQIPIFQQQQQQQQQQQPPPQHPAYAYYPDMAAPYPHPVQMMAPQPYSHLPEIPPQAQFGERAFHPSSSVHPLMESPYMPLLQPMLQNPPHETLPPVPQYPLLPPHVRLPAISEPQQLASVSRVPGLLPPPMMVSNPVHEQYGFRPSAQAPYHAQPLVTGKEQYHIRVPGQEQAPPWATNPPNSYMVNTKTLVPRVYEQSNVNEHPTFRVPNMENIVEEQVSSYTRPPLQLPNPAATRSTETNSNLSSFDGSRKLTSLSSMSSSADRFAFASEAKQHKSTRH